jgi:hypothetical protein
MNFTKTKAIIYVNNINTNVRTTKIMTKVYFALKQAIRPRRE